MVKIVGFEYVTQDRMWRDTPSVEKRRAVLSGTKFQNALWGEKKSPVAENITGVVIIDDRVCRRCCYNTGRPRIWLEKCPPENFVEPGLVS